MVLHLRLLLTGMVVLGCDGKSARKPAAQPSANFATETPSRPASLPSVAPSATPADSAAIYGWWRVTDDSPRDLHGGALKLEAQQLTIISHDHRVATRACSTTIDGTHFTVRGCGRIGAGHLEVETLVVIDGPYRAIGVRARPAQVDELEAIGRAHDVHRATAARWLERIRNDLRDTTIRALRAELALPRADLDSIIHGVQSRLEISFPRILAGAAA